MVDRRKIMFDQLVRQASSANVLPGISIPPSQRGSYPAELDPAGNRRVRSGVMGPTTGDRFGGADHLGPWITPESAGHYQASPRVDRDRPMVGVGKEERSFIDGMHKIQNAYFTGADFGYEEDWDRNLGVTQEMIDMFMSVPEEALKYAMENPTDAVLEQFEEFYGFPLNVNDRDMAKYFAGG
jgi:hypothetical protein